jgi:hypothetical protein
MSRGTPWMRPTEQPDDGHRGRGTHLLLADRERRDLDHDSSKGRNRIRAANGSHPSTGQASGAGLLRTHAVQAVCARPQVTGHPASWKAALAAEDMGRLTSRSCGGSVARSSRPRFAGFRPNPPWPHFWTQMGAQAAYSRFRYFQDPASIFVCVDGERRSVRQVRPGRGWRRDGAQQLVPRGAVELRRFARGAVTSP